MMRKMIVFALVIVAAVACRSDDIRINVTFEQLSGLAKGDRVLFESNAAGKVSAVEFNPNGSYTVQIEIDKGFANAATEYSQFFVIEDADRRGHNGVEIRLSQRGGTPLASGTTVTGSPQGGDLASKLQGELEAGIGFLKNQIEKFGQDVQAIPESQEYKHLKESLKDLGAEIERQEKQARETVKQEWLPRIQRELDELRERLKQLGREDELAPLDREMERIRRI